MADLWRANLIQTVSQKLEIYLSIHICRLNVTELEMLICSFSFSIGGLKKMQLDVGSEPTL